MNNVILLFMLLSLLAPKAVAGTLAVEFFCDANYGGLFSAVYLSVPIQPLYQLQYGGTSHGVNFSLENLNQGYSPLYNTEIKSNAVSFAEPFGISLYFNTPLVLPFHRSNLQLLQAGVTQDGYGNLFLLIHISNEQLAIGRYSYPYVAPPLDEMPPPPPTQATPLPFKKRKIE